MVLCFGLLSALVHGKLSEKRNLPRENAPIRQLVRLEGILLINIDVGEPSSLGAMLPQTDGPRLYKKAGFLQLLPVGSCPDCLQQWTPEDELNPVLPKLLLVHGVLS